MFEKVQKIIAEQLGIDAAAVQPASKFKEDLNADSLDLFEMVMAMEETVRGLGKNRYCSGCD